MLALGTKAPDFSLTNILSGQAISLNSFSSKKAFLVMFLCRHCPYVQHIKEEISRLCSDYKDKDIGIVAINSNDASIYTDDSPESLKEFALEQNLSVPFCHDETQEVAKVYTASCTPDFFLFDKERKLVYRGQLDDSRPGNFIPLTGKDLRQAIDAVLQDKEISSDQKPSSGCNIKWKPGNEPSYFNPAH